MANTRLGYALTWKLGYKKKYLNYFVLPHKQVLTIIMVSKRMFYLGVLKYKMLLCN